MRKKKKTLIFIVALVIACFGIGYAYLTTTLSINGVTDVDMNNWDVYFDNIQVLDGSITGSQVIDEAEIVDDTTVEFHVNLKKPGDYYVFTVDAKNDGTIDAMIESVVKKINGSVVTTLPAYLDYSVTYEDSVPIAENHLLASESVEKYLVKVGYKGDISASDLPSTAQSLTLSFGVDYIQADNNAAGIRNYAYSADYVEIGANLPNEYVYDNYQDVIDEFGKNFFTRYTVVDGKVFNSYVGFIVDNNVYYLRGGKFDISYQEMNYIYYQNKNVLKNAFGEENCNEENNYYYCSNSTIAANVSNVGKVLVSEISTNIFCEVSLVGTSDGRLVWRTVCGSELI